MCYTTSCLDQERLVDVRVDRCMLFCPRRNICENKNLFALEIRLSSSSKSASLFLTKQTAHQSDMTNRDLA